jgi:hypothetical protein
MTYPLLTSRNAQICSHLKATMTDSLILAEALLLSEHLQIYKFYSGQTLHTFLNKQIPEGWKWRESDQETYDKCWEALVDGIQDKIVGFTPTTHTAITSDGGEGVAEEEVVDVPEREVGKKRKKNKSKGKGGGGGGKTPKPSGGGGGRFDLLSGLDG